MTRTINPANPDALLDEIKDNGYAYLTDDGVVTDEMPDRGWYVRMVDGSGTAIRLTDMDDDPYVGPHTAHLRTDFP